MIDWTKSMEQTYEYYTVDPGTWMDVDRIKTVKSSTISRDEEVETRGSASIDLTETLPECYVRIYLVATQNGITEKHPLGTFLVQTPSSTFDGRVSATTLDAYTPLIELKENQPPLGYSVLKDDNIMKAAYRIVRDRARAPVVETTSDKTLYYDFVANTDDTWMSFLIDLIDNANYGFDIDEIGRILFAPKQDLASLQPVWTYNDDNSSILYPEVTTNEDIFDVPNAVEVIYSNGGDNYYAKVVNDDPNSPVSTVTRGREICHRIVNPDFGSAPSQYQIQQHAEQQLKTLSTLQRTISYSHGYCPVRLGDCVRINYEKAGLTNIKARVISQSIKCVSGCTVSEKAVYTVKLWR